MIRATIGAAITAALITMANPVQAAISSGGLSAHLARSSAAPVEVEPVHYRQYRHSHRYQRYYHRRQYRRYRHCWNDRVRVRVPGGYFVWRTHRRCGWRY